MIIKLEVILEERVPDSTKPWWKTSFQESTVILKSLKLSLYRAWKPARSSTLWVSYQDLGGIIFVKFLNSINQIILSNYCSLGARFYYSSDSFWPLNFWSFLDLVNFSIDLTLSVLPLLIYLPLASSSTSLVIISDWLPVKINQIFSIEMDGVAIL